MPPVLIGLQFLDGLRPKHVPFSDYYDLTLPGHALKDWKIQVQGSQVVLVGPPKDGQSVLVQLPRTRVGLYWSGTEPDAAQLDRAQWPPAPAKDGKSK